MARRNGRNYLRSTGNTNELGVISFGYFSLDKQRKVTRPAGRKSASKTPKLKKLRDYLTAFLVTGLTTLVEGTTNVLVVPKLESAASSAFFTA